MNLYSGLSGVIALLSSSSAFAVTTNSFILPYDAIVSVQPQGGSGAAVTEFGTGTSQANMTPVFVGLPGTSNSYAPVSLGYYAGGSPLNVYMKTTFGETSYAFSSDVVTAASLTSFSDTDNSLGYGGTVYEQINTTTYRMHLDDARSAGFDDDDDDVFIQVTLQAVPEPSCAGLLAASGVLLIRQRRHQ